MVLQQSFILISVSCHIHQMCKACLWHVQPQLLFKEFSTDGNKNRKTIFNKNDSSMAAVHQQSTQDKG